jgi:glutamyl-Q tRNA(Asp) synthetase
VLLPDHGPIGRFAPSPTGPLHLGSLLAALASYLSVHAQRGRWLIRLEDIDPPREQAGATQHILELLQHYGLHSDAPVLVQSSRTAQHWHVLQDMLARELAFPCYCSRSALGQGVHFGRCLAPQDAEHKTPSYRFNMQSAPEWIAFTDAIQGRVQQNLHREVGDFVLWRADGWPSYQLACVLDDAASHVSEIVRGQDLLDSTPRQIALQQVLQLPQPRYAHIPLVLGHDGQKLSKQNLAPALDRKAAVANLKTALKMLGQEIPSADTPTEILRQASRSWRLDAIPKHNQKA